MLNICNTEIIKMIPRKIKQVLATKNTKNQLLAVKPRNK